MQNNTKKQGRITTVNVDAFRLLFKKGSNMVLFRALFTVFLLFCFNPLQAEDIPLKDKIGQMLIIGFEGKTIDSSAPVAKAIDEHHVGGVILYDFNDQKKKYDMNIESYAQVTLLNRQLQQITHKANLKHHRPDLPLLISVDYEGGTVNRLKENYGFPPTISQKKIGKMPLEDAEKVAKSMADTLKTSGFNLDFAPVTDLDVNSENPIIGKQERSYSRDPLEVSKSASLFSEEFVKNGVQCAYKHFPGHGSSTTDSHLGFVDVTDTWHEQELTPYLELLSQPIHCGVIMTAHIINRKLDPSGLPATLSPAILTELLRHELKFDGVIVTDDIQMRAISDNYSLEETLTRTINAGADMLLIANQFKDTPEDPTKIIQIISDKVKQGEIPMARINDAYRHILKLKMGLH